MMKHGLYVRVLVTSVRPARVDELTEMKTHVGPRNHTLYKGTSTYGHHLANTTE